jgi:hypothetical protein
MDQPAPTDPARRATRIGPALASALLAFVIGIALMAFAMRNAPGWFTPARPATPAARSAVAPPVPGAPELAARNAALAARLTTLEARAAAIDRDSAAAAGQAGRAEAILIAFAARRAIDRGVGLGYLEQELRQRFAPTLPRESVMAIRAARARVTLEDLRTGLDAAAPTLLARESDWWAGVGGELRNLVVIHRAGEPSPLPADRLARARRMVEAGQVEAALGEVTRMPGAGQAGNWTAAARRYVEARRALDALEAAAITGAISAPAAAVTRQEAAQETAGPPGAGQPAGEQGATP